VTEGPLARAGCVGHASDTAPARRKSRLGVLPQWEVLEAVTRTLTPALPRTRQPARGSRRVTHVDRVGYSPYERRGSFEAQSYVARWLRCTRRAATRLHPHSRPVPCRASDSSEAEGTGMGRIIEFSSRELLEWREVGTSFRSYLTTRECRANSPITSSRECETFGLRLTAPARSRLTRMCRARSGRITGLEFRTAFTRRCNGLRQTSSS